MISGATGCPDDRIVLARRGAVASQEWEAFMAHVRVCGDCAAVWRAARAFERVGRAQPEDEHLARRAVQAALGRESRRWKFARHPALVAAVWVLLAGAVASAGVFAYRELKQAAVSSEGEPPTSAAPEKGRRRRAHPRLPIAAPEPEPEPDPGETPPLIDPPAPAPAVEAVAAPEVIEASRPSPADRRAALFARALAARGAGRSTEAVTLLRRLQREFPRTPEATVSLVSLGELLIDASAPEEALASFDRYLRQAPSGPLVPEALAAKARALDQLRRGAEAAAARRELRRRIPEWPYGTPAQAGDREDPTR